MSLIIIDTEDAEAGYRLASTAPGVRVVRPEQLFCAPHDLPRDVAVRFFSPIADELTRPGPHEEVLVLPARWPSSLAPGLGRCLARAALAAGAVLARPGEAPNPAPGAGNAPGEAPLLARGAAKRGSGPPRRPPGPLTGFPRGAFSGPGGLAALSARGWANPGPGAGAFRPGVTLLVGERPGVARSGELKHRLPFVTFTRSGCALWLTEQLEVAGVPESDLYWINAYDALGIPTSSDFVSALEPNLIVALGDLAERWCRAAELTHVAVPHPQYWKRFRAREDYPLLGILKENDDGTE